MNIPQEVIDRARAIDTEASNHNAMVWPGEYRDELLQVVRYVWRVAHEAGYEQGCEDSR